MVSGNTDTGGLAGDSALGTVSSSFWDTQTSTQISSAGGTGLLTHDMQDINIYLNAGWDFIAETANGTDDIWFLTDFDYPRFVRNAVAQP